MSRTTGLLAVVATAIASLAVQSATATAVTVSNDSLEILVDESSGTLRVVDRVSGRTWTPDPWENSAGLLQVATPAGMRSYDLSRASSVSVTRTSELAVRIEFRSTEQAGTTPLWCVTTLVSVAPKQGSLSLKVAAVDLPERHVARKLYYPARPFSLRTDVDRGAAAIPFWQGVIIPSHIFPMNGGRFCMWDDAQHGSGAIGELTYYGWHGLTMPWFGTHDERSAMMAVVPRDGSVGMQWIANYNNFHEVATRYSHAAPLFNLVYHDAVTNFGKIQDSNHLPTSPAGDYYVKTLRAMLHGDGPMVFFSPYEYEGIRPYIKLAAKMLGPLHESIAFKELVAHRFLSPDFLVQQTEFAGGVHVTVNLGSTPFRMPEKPEKGSGVVCRNGPAGAAHKRLPTPLPVEIPGYGFRVVKENGQVIQGRFRHSVVLDGQDIDF